MKYLIIGGFTAAVGCIDGIRAYDKTGDITLITAENYFNYSRPMISYMLLKNISAENMKYKKDSFYEENNCRILTGTKALSIDTQKKCVLLDNGTTEYYDKLLLATGSSAFIPEIKGLENVKEKCTFTNMEDALNLKNYLQTPKKVLIMGAGLIGLKCAEGISSMAESITVVDMAQRVLPNNLDERGSQIVKKHLEEQGIKFILSDSCVSFDEKKAHLKSGETIDFDVLVIAVGVRANVQLAIDAGIGVERGILTDDFCATNVKDIYAAGDCSESYDMSTGQRKVIAILPNAYFQGETAGAALVGVRKIPLHSLPMNATGFMGLHIVSAGSYTGEKYVVEGEDGSYKALYYEDDLLKGFILVGDVARAGIYTSLIRNKTPLSELDFELIKNEPQLMAFEKKHRISLMNSDYR